MQFLNKACQLAHAELEREVIAVCLPCLQAQAHAPEVDVHKYATGYLDRLAAEASARIKALETSPVTNRQVREDPGSCNEL